LQPNASSVNVIIKAEDNQLKIAQEGPKNGPRRVKDMSTTYISKANVDLWKQTVTLEWTGLEAAMQPKGPFDCTPGRGIAGINCDDAATSRLANTNCTPKGEWKVGGHQRRFASYPEAEWVTLFDSLPRGIALHYYPVVPLYPSSHGCVRLADYAIAQKIWENTVLNVTLVSVQGELRPQPVVLQREDRGENVRKVQRQLTEKGYDISIDGDFGPATEAAIRQFQQDAKLSQIDGIFGLETYTALFQESSQNNRNNSRVLVSS